MLWTLCLSVFAASPEVHHHLRYLDDTGRGEEAKGEARRLIEADPQDVPAHLQWIQLHRGEGPLVATALEQTYKSWLISSPEDPGRKLALALAIALQRAGGEGDGRYPGRPGPWCDEVLDLLDPSAADMELRARILWTRQFVLERCGRDDTTERLTIQGMSESADAAKLPAAQLRLGDDVVDEADAEAIAALLQAQPWRAPDLRRLWREETQGPGLERARALVLDAAATLMSRDAPDMVDAAFRVFNAAHRPDEAEAALARLHTLDPERPWFPSVWRERGEQAEPEPLVLAGAAKRLEELGEDEPENRFEALDWTLDRAELLLELGRDEEALDALRRAYVLDPGIRSNLRYAREAVRQGRQLRSASRAARVAVYLMERRDLYVKGGAEALQSQHEQLAEALAVRASVALAREHRRRAERDALRSLLVEESAEAHLVLGLAMREDDEDAFWHLSLGMSGDARRPDLRPAALARMEALWPQQGYWHPAGLAGWLEINWELNTKPIETEREPFPDLMITLDGESKQLSTISGPVVVDLWATWCGPCREGLPDFDQAARANPGVTFLALSVDDELTLAERFLSASAPAFRSAWAGPEAMKALGVSGIPATFVLDADHRVLDRWTGWGPGDTRLEEALVTLAAELRRSSP